MKLLLAALAVVGLLTGNSPRKSAQDKPQNLMVNQETGGTQQRFAARTAWWRVSKFGMFIHWGVYSVPADSTDLNGRKGVGEWYFNNKRAQVADYEKFAGKFNPVKFSAHAWVKMAKDAGMKYMVITSKHHDGFCMFNSALTGYSIARATPFKRDPMKELAAECKKQGVRLCFYYSIMDWHHPDYLPRRPWDVRSTEGADFSKYLAYMRGQLTELLSNYGPVGVVWFDGGWEHKADALHSLEVVKMMRSLQPGLIINDRINLPEDHSTPEQTIPANALPGGRLWETCMTMNDTWGFAKNDTNWKSPDDLVHKLCDIASKGGNFLLNVGPTSRGEFPPAIVERLADIGRWMKVNSASIYGTTKSPWSRTPFDGRATVKGSTLYLQVFNWPAGPLTVPGLTTKVVSAVALAGKQNLGVTQDAAAGTVTIARPAEIDRYATVVAVKLASAPQVSVVETTTAAGSNGSFTLAARDAVLEGSTIQYENSPGHDCIGYWTNPQDYVVWKMDVRRAARYRVQAVMACEPGSEGTVFRISCGGNSVDGTVASTQSWTDFHTVDLGTMMVPAGKQSVSVKATSKPNYAVMNLQTLRLTPLPDSGAQ